MTTDEILAEIERMGTPTIKKIFQNHGAPEPIYGCKIEDLKKILKHHKNNTPLALELFDTGVSDAMYLAGLMAVPGELTKSQLQKWAKKATWHMISEFTVPGVAAESEHGLDLAVEWIASKQEKIAASGWATWNALIGIKPNDELDFKLIEKHLKQIEKSINHQPDRVRLGMNGFIIAVGCYIPELAKEAKRVAKAIGKVEADMGNTSCKIPDAQEYIAKVEKMGRQGKKRKSARC